MHGYLHEEALASELAGRFYLGRGYAKLAQVYLRDAHGLYLRWGAQAKTRQLETSYPQFIGQSVKANQMTDTRATITNRTHKASASVLDIASVVKASQTISGEIVLDNLLKKLMNTVLENAGAERGLLLLEREGQWVIEAEGSINSAEVTMLQSRPTTSTSVPQTILNYVARTRESLVLSAAAEGSDFARDAYVLARRPASILCMPLLHQSKLVGLLYLENNYTSDAFTADRLEVLNLLSGQVAISIDHAHLYAHMEDLVAARTAELSEAYQSLKALNDRLQAELTLARRIQQSLLPPPRPDWQGVQVVCYTAPAREVGGDLYAYHALDDGQYVVAVGDVSGKGMPAALLMSATVASFHSLVLQRMQPGDFLTQMSLAITSYTRTTSQNCALVYVNMVRDPASSTGAGRWQVRVANAGCIYPLIKRHDGSFLWAEVGGLPLGVGLSASLGYQEINLEAAPGDMIILVSDGVVEAGNAADELFGFERLEAAVQSGPQTSADAMLLYLRAAVEMFVGTTEPHDDITIVVAQV